MKFEKDFLKNVLQLEEEEIDLVLEFQEKMPLISSRDSKFIDGRKLHGELGVLKAFSTWIKLNLDNIDAVKNKDYTVSFYGNAQFEEEEIQEMSSQKRSSYGITEEYKISLETAKEISMVAGMGTKVNAETKHKSKICRKYFILMESVLHKWIEHNEIRDPQKEGYKKMCIELEGQYFEENPNTRKVPQNLNSNNADMLNRALLGKSAKKIKEFLDVNRKAQTRENLTTDINNALIDLQDLNTNLAIARVPYLKRKEIIEANCLKKYIVLKQKFDGSYIYIDKELGY